MTTSEKARLEHARQQLLQLKSELEEFEADFTEAGKTVELDQQRTGRLTRMDAMQAQQMSLEGGRRRQQQLLRIAGALKRIDSGDYGVCFGCGDEINQRRLDIDPTLTRCMACAEEPS